MQPSVSVLKKILDGKHDAYVSSWARAAAAWGKPFFLRFAHEMNGDWTTWSPGVNGNTAREFVTAWKRVHGIYKLVVEHLLKLSVEALVKVRLTGVDHPGDLLLIFRGQRGEEARSLVVCSLRGAGSGHRGAERSARLRSHP